MRQVAVAERRRRLGRAPLRTSVGAPGWIVGGGLLLVTAGALLDIGHHAGLAVLTAEQLGTAGHLLTLAGMVLTAVAVALAATFRRR